MNKFLALLKKEIRELLTPQMFVPLVIIVVVFFFLGKVAGKEAQKAQKGVSVAVLNFDRSAQSDRVVTFLKETGLVVHEVQGNSAEEVVRQEWGQGLNKSVIVIPKGFSTALANGQQAPLETYAIIRNFSFAGSRKANITPQLAMVSEKIRAEDAVRQGVDPVVMKSPIALKEYTIAKDHIAQVSLDQVIGFITSQTTFIPIILFMVISFAAGLIAGSVASEKENKTLETLLSTPINRKALVAAKLIAAGLVALLSTGIYVIGLRSYLGGLTGGASQAGAQALEQSLQQLGLVMSGFDYLLLAVSLFLGILVALAIAMILGSFAQDTKSVQGVVTPLMVLALVPYILIFVLDMETVSKPMRYLIYAIPFSHSFLAAPHIMLGDYKFVVFGYAYLLVIFLIAVYVAAWLFSSEKILTMNFSFKRK